MSDATAYTKKPRSKEWRRERAEALAAGKRRNKERHEAKRAAEKSVTLVDGKQRAPLKHAC